MRTDGGVTYNFFGCTLNHLKDLLRLLNGVSYRRSAARLSGPGR